MFLFPFFSIVVPYIWPLAGPNIAKKGWPLQTLARDDRQTHFGTFDFWVKPGFGAFYFGNARFWRLGAPKTYISGRTDGGLNFQAVIKSAASAASPIAWGEPGRRLRLAGGGFGALPKQSKRLR